MKWRQVLGVLFIARPPLCFQLRGTGLQERQGNWVTQTVCIMCRPWCRLRRSQLLTCGLSKVEIRGEVETRCLSLKNLQLRVFQRAVSRCRTSRILIRFSKWQHVWILVFSLTGVWWKKLWTYWRSTSFCPFWCPCLGSWSQRCLSTRCSQGTLPGEAPHAHGWWSWNELS